MDERKNSNLNAEKMDGPIEDIDNLWKSSVKMRDTVEKNLKISNRINKYIDLTPKIFVPTKESLKFPSQHISLDKKIRSIQKAAKLPYSVSDIAKPIVNQRVGILQSVDQIKTKYHKSMDWKNPYLKGYSGSSGSFYGSISAVTTAYKKALMNASKLGDIESLTKQTQVMKTQSKILLDQFSENIKLLTQYDFRIGVVGQKLEQHIPTFEDIQSLSTPEIKEEIHNLLAHNNENQDSNDMEFRIRYLEKELNKFIQVENENFTANKHMEKKIIDSMDKSDFLLTEIVSKSKNEFASFVFGFLLNVLIPLPNPESVRHFLIFVWNLVLLVQK
ncbi:hypothetical protein MFLO_07167 [Listeria floridensis FSL S10-1187]|uniref:Uncharacterized protein n=1 Tax=Listeria floridensis FSL S10-1187 TaxID=1265817 RepID=A0ABN0RFY5_9LIST|nr:hypothetical protein [Listeria floridensis]EUJ32304.1 hypothetical protein MFLO_07167 [Listeria floridensis FSL S10-1187]